MKVSFITTVRNEAATIGKYLESLAQQSRKPDEVVIVDGGSTDWTVDEIRARANLFANMRIIVQECNIAAGRNLAAHECSGMIIAMSDAGSSLDQDWLRAIVAPFELDLTLDVVAGNWTIEPAQGWPDLFRWFFLNKNGLRDGPSNPLNPSARSVAVRKTAWDEMGGHPEFLYAGEDTLFNLKWSLHGKRAIFAKDAVCTWYMHQRVGGFLRQIFNYSRAGGRFARSSSLTYLGYLFRNLAIYIMGIIVLIALGIKGDSWCRAVTPAVASLLIFLLIRQKGDHYRSARVYGYSRLRALLVTGFTLCTDLVEVAGVIAGLSDRRLVDFEILIYKYIILHNK